MEEGKKKKKGLKSHSCFFFLLSDLVARRDGEFGVFKPPASLQDASSSPSDQPFPCLCKYGLLYSKAKRGHLFQAGTECKLPLETKRKLARRSGESRRQHPPPQQGCAAPRETGLTVVLWVITAIRTKPAKLLPIPFLFVLNVIFQALPVPPPEPSLCQSG